MAFPSRSLCTAAVFLTTLTALFAQEPVIAPASRYPADLSSVQVADLNSNNAPDIIGLDNTSAAVVVLKNSGNGKYGAPTYYAISGQPNGIAVGDFNGDGRLDVAVATGTYNEAHGQVAVLLGNGDGTLQLPVYHTVPIPANSIAVADFNNDNKPDIAVIGNTNSNGTNTVAILTNTGSSFTEHSFDAPIYFTPSGLGPNADFIYGLAAGDFNGDGRMDLAYLDECTQCSVSEESLFILANTPSGWEAKMPSGGTGISSIKAADIDGDGITDLVTPYRGCHTPCVGVIVSYMQRDFTVAKSVSLDVMNDGEGPTPSEVVVGDFNNDGVTDIAGYAPFGLDINYNPIPPGVMMWTGTGNRSFNQLKYYYQPSPPAQIDSAYTAGGFLDKNGTLDLVVPVGPNVQVWRNSTSDSADPCSYPNIGGVHVCSPSGNVPSGTVHFVAAARTNTQPLNRIELWVDGQKRFQVFADRMHIDLSLADGTHTAAFIEVGASGLRLKRRETFTVGGK